MKYSRVKKDISRDTTEHIRLYFPLEHTPTTSRFKAMPFFLCRQWKVFILWIATSICGKIKITGKFKYSTRMRILSYYVFYSDFFQNKLKLNSKLGLQVYAIFDPIVERLRVIDVYSSKHKLNKKNILICYTFMYNMFDKNNKSTFVAHSNVQCRRIYLFTLS